MNDHSRRPPRRLWFHALGAKVGGGITYLRNVLPLLADRLGQAGVDITLLLPGQPNGVTIPDSVDFKILDRYGRSPGSRLYFDQVVLPHWLRREPVGSVLFCSGTFAPVRSPVRTVTLVRNTIYFDPEFLQAEAPATRVARLAQRELILRGIHNADAIVYPTRSMRRLVEQLAPALRGRGCVVPYGIGAEFLQREDGEFRARGPVFTFLYVMTYTLQKNLSAVLEALALARAAGAPVRLLLTSLLEDGPPAAMARDRALIREHRLIDSGYLLPLGPQAPGDLLRLYGECDACLFASMSESFGHPLVEAMAMGKPLLCAERPYARELCGDHPFYFDPRRPEQLADAWVRWPELVARFRPAAIESIRARFSWERHVDALVNEFFPGEAA